MTTILTPVDELEVGMKFMIGVTLYKKDGSRARPVDGDGAYFFKDELRVIFPDGVPVIQPDKPKEVRCVVQKSGHNGILITDGAELGGIWEWVFRHLTPGKTYDLVLTEREDSK